MTKRLQIFLLAIVMHGSLLAQFESGPTMLGGEIVAKLSTNATQVTLTLTGPIDRYFAIGFGGMGMFGVRDAFIWNASTNLDYNISGRSVAADVTQDWALITNTTTATTRTVTATRNLAGATENDYTFLNSANTINVIYAYGHDENVAEHASRGSGQITLTPTLSLSPNVLQVTKQNNTNTLTWQMPNNSIKQYDVEKSINGTAFASIKTIDVLNNSVNAFTYNAAIGIEDVVYYRLKVTNINGEVNYSNIVKVVKDVSASVSLFPNPTKNTATLLILNTALIGTNAWLTNSKGNIIKQIKITSNMQLINLSAYATGIYFIKLSNYETLKLIKK